MSEQHEQAIRNIGIVGLALSLGIPAEAAMLMGAKPLNRVNAPAQQKTQADLDRIAAAEAKRQRKAAKRVKQAAA